MFEEIIGDEKLRRQREAVAQKQVFEAHKATIVPLVKKLDDAQKAYEVLKPKAVELLASVAALPVDVRNYCIHFTNELSALIHGLGSMTASQGEALKEAKQNLLALTSVDFGPSIYGRGHSNAQSIIDQASPIPAANGRIEELLKMIPAAAKRAAEGIKWQQERGQGSQGAVATLRRDDEPQADRRVDSDFGLLR